MRTLAQDDRSPLFIASTDQTRLDDIAAETYRGSPSDIEKLGAAIAHELDAKAPAVEGLQGEAAGLAKHIASELRQAKRPLIVGGASLSAGVCAAAADIAKALATAGKAVTMCLCPQYCNSMGLALLGGKSISDAVQAVREGKADTVIIVETDVYRCLPQEQADALLAAKNVIAIDHTASAATDKASIVLPAATFAEGDGTLVNYELRAQRFFRIMQPQGDMQESWRWLRDIMLLAERGETGAWKNLDDILAAIEKDVPAMAGISRAAPPADFRIDGLKIPRQPHRYSGRTAITANVSVHEPAPPDDADSGCAFDGRL